MKEKRWLRPRTECDTAHIIVAASFVLSPNGRTPSEKGNSPEKAHFDCRDSCHIDVGRERAGGRA